MINEKNQVSQENSDSGLFEGDNWQLPTDIELIEKAVDSFRQRLIKAGWPEDSANDLAVGFDEALANAMIHGNQRDVGKKVHVEMEIAADKAVIKIRDEGQGFNVEEVADPTNPDAVLKPSGRGILMMRLYYDKVQFNEKGNEITMVKVRN